MAPARRPSPRIDPPLPLPRSKLDFSHLRSLVIDLTPSQDGRVEIDEIVFPGRGDWNDASRSAAMVGLIREPQGDGVAVHALDGATWMREARPAPRHFPAS